MNTVSNKKVLVGMSGGVDSSVAAAELQQQGYDVTGAFIKVWQPPFAPCDWKSERQDAMRVCAHLGIPFMTIDLEDAYKNEVVDYMISEYRAGRTPNPDVMCNRHIKFGAFLEYAQKQGFDFIATGHHARVQYDSASATYQLLTGVDSNKDQSYFLWTLTQNELHRTLMPVGAYTKDTVRDKARSYRLPTAEKRDSQGLCFLGKIDMKDFLKQYIPESSGVIVNEAGDIVGDHDGVHFYTIGQRHGFTIRTQTPHTSPYYIVKKDAVQNTLVVSTIPRESVFRTRFCSLRDVNLIGGGTAFNGELSVRFRYRQPCVSAHMSVSNGEATVEFFEEQSGISSGQSLVAYNDAICVGGGVIV